MSATPRDEEKSSPDTGEDADINYHSDMLSKHGSVFRMKLMEHLKPAQHYSSKGSQSTRRHFTKDVVKGGGLFMDRMMAEDPYAHIDFTAWTYQQHIRLGVTPVSRRKNRTLIKHKKTVGNLFEKARTIDFLHFMLNNTVFRCVILIAGVINIVSQYCWDAYYEDLVHDIHEGEAMVAYYAIVYMDHLVVFVFLTEVVLWCFYDWKHYIRSYTFWVTVLALCSTGYMALLLLFNGIYWIEIHNNPLNDSIWSLKAQKTVLLICQSCRLMLCTRIMFMFNQSATIMTAVIQALPSLTYVALIMCLSTSVYWLLGMNFFVDYERQQNTLVLIRYTELGMGDGQAFLLFLFRVFTFDHFLQEIKDASALHGDWATFYIILWMIISNYIFANLFAAVLINNFGTVRQKLEGKHQRVKEIEARMDDLKELNMQLKLGGKELRREKQFDLQQKKPIKESKASIETNWKSNGSVVLASHFAVESDEEISYRTRFKMRVHHPPTCDVQGYLTAWPPVNQTAKLVSDSSISLVFLDNTNSNARSHQDKSSKVEKGNKDNESESHRKKKEKKRSSGEKRSNPSSRRNSPKFLATNPDQGKPKKKDSKPIDKQGIKPTPIDKRVIKHRASTEDGKRAPLYKKKRKRPKGFNIPDVIISATSQSSKLHESAPAHSTLRHKEQRTLHEIGPDKKKSSVSFKDHSKITYLGEEQYMPKPAPSLPSQFTMDLYRSGISPLTKHYNPKEAMSQESVISLDTDSVAMDNRRLNAMMLSVKSLKHSKVTSIWAKDTLFEFFRAMEQLYENLHERKQLLNQLNQAILNLTDDERTTTSKAADSSTFRRFMRKINAMSSSVKIHSPSRPNETT